MKENKGLSDEELVLKYESGSIDLSKILKKAIFKNENISERGVFKVKLTDEQKEKFSEAKIKKLGRLFSATNTIQIQPITQLNVPQADL